MTLRHTLSQAIFSTLCCTKNRFGNFLLLVKWHGLHFDSTSNLRWFPYMPKCDWEWKKQRFGLVMPQKVTYYISQSHARIYIRRKCQPISDAYSNDESSCEQPFGTLPVPKIFMTHPSPRQFSEIKLKIWGSSPTRWHLEQPLHFKLRKKSRRTYEMLWPRRIILKNFQHQILLPAHE